MSPTQPGQKKSALQMESAFRILRFAPIGASLPVLCGHGLALFGMFAFADFLDDLGVEVSEVIRRT